MTILPDNMKASADAVETSTNNMTTSLDAVEALPDAREASPKAEHEQLDTVSILSSEFVYLRD